ncbi:MAG: hypothetical protein HY369_00510 [Candidatus Aenigmarchaeota archaeon]|nr:hypothetical protein [Candidatus Aenigmarchaeota archaeon]
MGKQRLCRWCGDPIAPYRKRTFYCCDECQFENAYEKALRDAIPVAQTSDKVVGMAAAHPAAPKDATLVAIEGETAILGWPSGKKLKRPLAEVYSPEVVRVLARDLWAERTALPEDRACS